MPKIEDIDKNFKTSGSLSREDTKSYNPSEAPFKLYGIMPPDEEHNYYHRMPRSVAENVNNRMVEILHAHTAGARVRFTTDSDYIAIRARYNLVSRMSHMAFAGSMGFDLYANEGGSKFVTAFIPSADALFCTDWFDIPGDTYIGEKIIKDAKMREYTLNFPLYAGISELEIILSDKATVLPCSEYKISTPVVYYGSSITQGACASRPGTAYQSIISRRYDCDFWNLGFSGGADATDEMSDYVANQEMSAFVYDYDHNALNVEDLENTHEKMFKKVREAHPDIPIICASRPDYYTNPHDLSSSEPRRKVILKTVENAQKSGDANVYFADGKEVANILNGGDNITVDGIHPNDLGFLSMANLIGPLLDKSLLTK